MLGLRTPSSGTMRLDGVDLAGWPREQLIGAVGYLPQDVELFAGTVAHNIARLGEIDSERVIEAARLAGVHEMILRLPNAYETEVGDGGLRHSRAVNASVSRWRELCMAVRNWSCLTSPTPISTAKVKRPCRPQSTNSSKPARPWCWFRTDPPLMRCADKLAVLRDGTLDLFGPREQVLARLGPGMVHPLRRPSVDIPQEAQA